MVEAGRGEAGGAAGGFVAGAIGSRCVIVDMIESPRKQSRSGYHGWQNSIARAQALPAPMFLRAAASAEGLTRRGAHQISMI
jgi:hypothetical protein